MTGPEHARWGAAEASERLALASLSAAVPGWEWEDGALRERAAD